MNKRNLITGGAGFLGSHLAEKLATMGHEIIGIDNMLGGYEDNIPKNIKFYNIDCCDLKEVKKIIKGVQIVYHCAATAHEGLSVFSPYEINKKNVQFNFHGGAEWPGGSYDLKNEIEDLKSENSGILVALSPRDNEEDILFATSLASDFLREPTIAIVILLAT